MEHSGTEDNGGPLITWKRAWLYALGWLVLVGILAVIPPLAVEFSNLDMSRPSSVLLVAASYVLIIVAVMTAARLVHRSWRVPLACCAELLVASGLLALIALILFVLLMQAASGPYY